MSSSLPLFVLQEIANATDIVNGPLKNSSRIKYTCFDVSKSMIAFGATSGGIYVFSRIPCEFIQLIPSKDGAITKLLISPDEKYIGFASGKGMVTVTECGQSSGRYTAMSKQHQGNEITAMAWGHGALFSGDDVGHIAVLSVAHGWTDTMAKTMFQSSSETIMCLDSRICQLDMKDVMLLVSTTTRCYICDTSKEQYRQIGQKLRDGEFGACFLDSGKPIENGSVNNSPQEIMEVKKFNIVDDDTGFALSESLANTLVYCARPSSRLWEATVDGTVRRTHQFKQVLGRKAVSVITEENYRNGTICLTSLEETESQSINFSKICPIDGTIFSHTKDALYFLNVQNVDETLWFDKYKDIVSCRIYRDLIYLWMTNGSLIELKYMRIDKFLLKCFLNQNYELCGKLCALYRNYLLSNSLSPKLHVLVGLREKLSDEIIASIKNVIEKFDSLKSEATQMQSGIYLVDNSYDSIEDLTKINHEDSKFTTISPEEAIQALKGLSFTVSDKLNTSKKILKEKWDGLEEKVKHLGHEKQVNEFTFKKPRDDVLSESLPILENTDIIYKESSLTPFELDNVGINQRYTDEVRICKLLYQYFRLSLVGKKIEEMNLTSIIDNYNCDIREIYKLMLVLEKYCVSIGALEDSKHVPNNIFLNYLHLYQNDKDVIFETIINDEDLYKYFVDSCITENMKSNKISRTGCECGFPLPFAQTNQTPLFSNLIDQFIEKQWSTQTRNQCYEICKKMPYLWRKILYLRRNEDMLNILRILLQMLDEELLHSFLPQFTVETWEKAIQLYVTLHANRCLNCNRKFDTLSVKDTLSWEDLGALMIKSVGGKKTIKLMEKHADLVNAGDLSTKFYHICLVVAMYEKYDDNLRSKLTDCLYSCYDFDDCRTEILLLLRSTKGGLVKNTALPIVIAANCDHWGLSPLHKKQDRTISASSTDEKPTMFVENKNSIIYTDLEGILCCLYQISNGHTDCFLCGLPLQNEVLVRDGGLWVFQCGHIFHGACLDLNQLKLCPSCSPMI